MGEKEDRRREQRRRLFRRDGWQDDTGDWFTVCANCGTSLSWGEAGARKHDPAVPGRPDAAMELVCKAGCNPKTAAHIKRVWAIKSNQQLGVRK